MLAYNQSSGRVISIFVMQGCGACHEYQPRVQRIYRELQAQGYCLPELEFVDANDQRRQADANRFKVLYTPTTVFQRPDGFWKKWETALTDEQIRYILTRSARGQQCEI